MAKIIFMIVLTFFSLGKEAIILDVKYDTLLIRKNKADNENLEITGLENGKEVISEVYRNEIFISGKRYKYINGKKVLLYERNVELNQDNEVVIDDEVVYYLSGKLRQRFKLFPKGYPLKNNEYDNRIKFSSTYFNEEGEIINSEAGLYPVVSNVLFTPLFIYLVRTKELIYLMDLKK
ncbi:hypothetical protein [Sebaldella sp. S0638]|uniref:hypothetical protein n=1 Tax=Sebaldella sp. S0638 TaxID=2957809 RepID=UPI00209DB80E|nr:hypothetical protein [Sebaldella sp. S0638]MCP1226459.1 hypothetical protein [Sebaldella sp. S0638]